MSSKEKSKKWEAQLELQKAEDKLKVEAFRAKCNLLGVTPVMILEEGAYYNKNDNMFRGEFGEIFRKLCRRVVRDWMGDRRFDVEALCESYERQLIRERAKQFKEV